MCIQTKIQQKLQQKAELDAQIAKLEQLELKTSPVKTLLAELLADYATEAPEDLAAIWQEILAIGPKFNLSVQPLAADELKAWESANAENERLREEARDNAIFWGEVKDKNKKLEEQLEEAQAEITERDKAWGELSDERDDLEKELAKLRSQLQQVQTTSEVPQNLTERALKLDKYCTQCVESDNFAGFVQKIQHIVAGNELSPNQQIETQVLTESATEEKSGIGQELENLYQKALVEPEHEPEEVTTTVESVLKAKGFFEPYDLEDYDSAEQVLSERLTVKEAEPEPAKPEAGTNAAQEADTERYRNFNQIFDLQDLKVDVRQHNNGDEFAGASFNFYKIRENEATICAKNLTYSKSLTAVECADKHPKALAAEIIGTYWQKLREEEERKANPYKKPEDDFIELVKLTPAVGYIKRRDNGELISAYAAFANRDAAGEKTATMAKPRAKKWAEHLHASFESCGWKVEEPRKATRMVAESGAKQQFAYEIKITGKFSIGQLQLLAEEDFSLLPNEVAAVKIPAALPTTAAPIYSVKVNGYEVATGSEEEMRVRFEEELKTFGEEGRDAIRLVRGNEIIDEWYLSEFDFVPAQDIDETNPEYWTLHTPTKTNFRVYRSLASGAAWVNSVYPYNPLHTKEAAAVDAVRRQLKAGKAE